MLFKWRGTATKEDFGDPLAGTDYQLCLYDGIAGTLIPVAAATAPAGGMCGKKPCWKDTAAGFTYSDAATTPDGLRTLKLKAGAAGVAKIVATARAPLFRLPVLPLSRTPRVTAQVLNSAGSCWSAEFDTPRRNDGRIFKARLP